MEILAEMHERARSAIDERRVPVLSETEAERRMGLLVDLKVALEALGVVSVLARRRRLVLQYNLSPCAPSGLTDPQLHVLTAGRQGVVTTEGRSFRLASGGSCPTDNPSAAAAAIAGSHGIAAGRRAR